MTNMNDKSLNGLTVRGAKNAIDQMKYEIAQDFGVQLGADETARSNGSVGGEITKRLVSMAVAGDLQKEMLKFQSEEDDLNTLDTICPVTLDFC
ncbi:hypothetical protein BK748_07935 [Bacillus thuringiensis serovar graciosensis]|nr:hypothetical protein BK748_07935 [Bacillus thuringiensis serovar graciosensis]